MTTARKKEKYIIGFEIKPRKLQVVKGPVCDPVELLTLIGEWKHVIFKIDSNYRTIPMWFWDEDADEWVKWKRALLRKL